MAKRKIEVKGREITIVNHLSSDEYISLTDIAKSKVVEFAHFRMNAGLTSFVNANEARMNGGGDD